MSEIVERHVIRFYAPYINSQGKQAYKGFATRRQALRFLGKELLLDQLFGEKVELDMGWGRPGLKDAIGDKEAFARLMRGVGLQCAEGFDAPVTKCARCGNPDITQGFCKAEFNDAVNNLLRERGLISRKENL